MPDEAIESLPVRDYSAVPREQTRIIGQKSAVGLIDTKDKWDMLRMDIIDKDPTIFKLMKGEPMTGNELIDWGEGSRNQFLFAIRGSGGVITSEKGELQGWVQFYPEKDERLTEIERKGFIEINKEINKGDPVFEVSYAKLPDAASGQIASGLRETLLLLPQELEKRDPRRSAMYKKHPFITAYVNPITNPDSVEVLKHSGFVRRGQVKYDKSDESSKVYDDVYVLDWNILYKKLDQATFSALGVNIKDRKND